MKQFQAKDLFRSDDRLTVRLYAWLGGKMAIFTLLAMMAALIARLTYLGEYAIYLDEAFSIHTAQRPVGDLLERIASDNNPPLHYLLLSFWVRIFGTTEEATRLMSTVLNVLSIPVLIAIARRYFNDKVAVYATLLFIISDIFIYYSQEARTYTLVSLLTLISFYYLFRLTETGSWKHALLLGLTNYLLLMSHYGVYVLFPMQGLAMLMYLPTHPKLFFRYFVGQIGFVLLFLPWYFYWQAHLVKSVTWVPKPSLKFVKYVLMRFAGNKTWLAVFQWLIILGLPITVAWRVWKGGQDWRRLAVLVLWGAGAFGLSILMSHLYKPSFRENYILFCLPALLLLLAWIWAELPLHGTFKLLVFSLAFLLMAHATIYNFHRPRKWSDTAKSIRKMKSKSTLIVLGKVYYMLPLTYYYSPKAFADYAHTDSLMGRQHVHHAGTGNQMKALRPEIFEDIIVVSLDVNLKDKKYFPIKYLQTRYKEIEVVKNGSIVLHHFQGKKAP